MNTLFTATLGHFGGSAFAAAGDSFLARCLAPTHLDPVIAAAPLARRLAAAGNGDDWEGGGDLEAIRRKVAEREKIQSEVLGSLEKWPARRIFAELRWRGEPVLAALRDIGGNERVNERLRRNAVSALIALEGLGAGASSSPLMVETFFLEALKAPSREGHVALFELVDADALAKAWLHSENRNDPDRSAHFARLMAGLLMLGEGLETFFDAFLMVPDEVRSAGLEALKNRISNFEESLEVIPQDDVLTAEREAADQVLACLRSTLGNEDEV